MGFGSFLIPKPKKTLRDLSTEQLKAIADPTSEDIKGGDIALALFSAFSLAAKASGDQFGLADRASSELEARGVESPRQTEKKIALREKKRRGEMAKKGIFANILTSPLGAIGRMRGGSLLLGGGQGSLS